MMSQLADKHADKCRFCWMCRHLCPVQLQTGKEVNTPRAKALLLSMVRRGKVYDESMAEVMYECLLCDACTDNCATGYQPPLYIREARTEAILNDLAPKAVSEVLDRIEQTGTIYGTEKKPYGKTGKAETLVYLGEVAAVAVPGMAKALLSLLDKAGVSYTVLEQEPASGVMLGDLTGYVEEVRQQAEICAGAINGTEAKEIVVLDSYDAEIMVQKYPEWGIGLKGTVVTATAYIRRLLKDGRLKIARKAEGRAVYHDDDRLARTFQEFTEARDIARELGYELVEMFHHERLAKSCGTSLAKAYMPELVKRIAAGRWEDMLRTKAEIMLTASPQAYECLAETVPEGRKLVDLFEALDGGCV